MVAQRRAGPDAVIAVLPADPFIADEATFERLVRLAIAEARETIVTIGVMPTHAETGFGYIRLGARLAARRRGRRARRRRLLEKPDRPTAERYVASGEYLWNSGMFFLTARRMLDEARRHLPALGALLDAAVSAPRRRRGHRAGYADAPSISIDHGIMEKATGLRVVPGAFGWNDVGSWAALPALRAPDARGNVVIGGAHAASTATATSSSRTRARPTSACWACAIWSSSRRRTPCWSSRRTVRRMCAASSRPRSNPAATICCDRPKEPA